MIARVIAGGQADRLGLRAGDILLRYDGWEVSSASELVRQRREEPAAGGPRQLVVLRDGKEHSVSVHVGPLSADLNTTLISPAAPAR